MILHLIRSLIVGAIAGWIANNLMKTDSSSLLVNIALGLLGGLVGGILLGLIGIGSRNFIGDIIVAVIGACIAIWLYHKIKD